MNLARASNGRQIRMKYKSNVKVRDRRIKEAMDGITNEDPIQRWSIKRFLDEMAAPDCDVLFETIDLSMRKKYNFIKW